jgi:hypothetical protein
MEKLEYFVCRTCGFFHRVGSNDCDSDSAFVIDELNETYGIDGWKEVQAKPAEIPKINGAAKNHARLMGLTQDIDINGKALVPGCRVRCFSGARYDAENDWLLGLDTIGVCCYIEGKLQGIKRCFEGAWNEGIYYLVEIDLAVCPMVKRGFMEFEILDQTETIRYTDGARFPKYVRVNGLDRPDGLKTFGVMRID